MATEETYGIVNVHVRTLWDGGWMYGDLHSMHYTSEEKRITYGKGTDLFYSPFSGYGAPEPDRGATRKIRLYMTYSHEMTANSTLVIRVDDYEGRGSVTIPMPHITGSQENVGAGFSDYLTPDQLKGIGHSYISAYYDTPTTKYGVIYKIEVYYYDDFNK